MTPSSKAKVLTDAELADARLKLIQMGHDEDGLYMGLFATIAADRRKIAELTERLSREQAGITQLAEGIDFYEKKLDDKDREIERLRKVVDAANAGLKLTHEFLPWTLLRKELRELAAIDQPTGGDDVK